MVEFRKNDSYQIRIRAHLQRLRKVVWRKYEKQIAHNCSRSAREVAGDGFVSPKKSLNFDRTDFSAASSGAAPTTTSV